MSSFPNEHGMDKIWRDTVGDIEGVLLVQRGKGLGRCVYECIHVCACMCQVLLSQMVVSDWSISGEIRANHGLLKHLSINTVAHWTQGNLQLFSSVCVYSVRWFCVTVLGKVSHELLRFCFPMKSLLKSIFNLLEQSVITCGIETDTHELTKGLHFSHAGLGYPQLGKRQTLHSHHDRFRLLSKMQLINKVPSNRAVVGFPLTSTTGLNAFLYLCLSISSMCLYVFHTP